jgi:hypothetical protein
MKVVGFCRPAVFLFAEDKWDSHAPPGPLILSLGGCGFFSFPPFRAETLANRLVRGRYIEKILKRHGQPLSYPLGASTSP